MCRCKDLVDGTPDLAIVQGIQVSLYQQQPDGSFAFLESASANNYFVSGNVFPPVAWRSDDQMLTYPTETKSNSFTLLQRDPLFEHYFQGVEDPELSGAGLLFSQGNTYLSTSDSGGVIGPRRPQTVNNPAGWTNPGFIVNHVGSTFASTSGASGQSLIATNYGDWNVPTFPPTISVVAVGLQITAGYDIWPDVFDAGVFLTLDGVNPVGNDQSHNNPLEPWGGSSLTGGGSGFAETRGYGSLNTSAYTATDPLWGLPSLTVDQINSPNFGVIFLMKSNSGHQGYIQDWELYVGFVTNAGQVYIIRKSSTFSLGPLNKTNITTNIGPVGMQDTSRLRSGATVQVMNANRTCKDNWYSTWSGVGAFAPPPSHPRPTTKTSPGVLCEWTDPTMVAYLPDSDGKIVCWSRDDFVIAAGAGAPLVYLFDGTNFTAGTMDTPPFSGTISAGIFAADGIHAAVVVGNDFYLAQRNGSRLGSWSQLTFVPVNIGDVNNTPATAQASAYDISADGGLLAFRAVNFRGLPERVHVYSATGTVLAVLVPANITGTERIQQIKFSDDVGTGSIALVVCTAFGIGNPSGRTSVFTSTDGGTTWTETWQNPFSAQGAAFAHAYRVNS